MASTGTRFYSFKAYLPGVRETLKSSGVRELLDRRGSSAAARCNSLFSLSGMRGASPEVDPYAYELVETDYSAAAKVHVNSKLGHADNVAHNTLRKGCS